MEFLIKISLYKKEHEDKLPEIKENNVNNIVDHEANDDKEINVKVETSEVEIQTDEDQLEQVRCSFF